LRTLGTSATSAAAGNDGRFTDARAPTAHRLTHEPGGADAMAVDAAAATGSLRTLGTTATAAAAGDHAHAPAATDSLLTNGSFDVWQRGVGPFTAVAAYTADRWALSQGTGSTMSASRDGTNQDAGSQYCAAIVYTQATTNVSRLIQILGDQYAQLRGRTVTLAVRVRVATASAVRISVWDSVNGFRYSGYHTGGGAYETLSVTAAIAAAATGVQVGVNFDASCTAYLDNATLVVGSAALVYAPLHPADELAASQRYYQEIGGLSLFEPVGAGANVSTVQTDVPIRLPVEMAGAPTVTYSAVGDFSLLGADSAQKVVTAIAVNQATRRSVRLLVSVASGLNAGGGTTMVCNNTLAARLRFQADP
jgi:hypothetical protein